MSVEIPITATEHGTVRIFAINLPPDEAKVWETETAKSDRLLETALGATTLDHEHLEVIDVEAVKSLGLSTYLVDGLGLPEALVNRDRARLDALSGRVLIMWSTAFASQEQVLKPGRQVTLIGTYREDPGAGIFEPIQSEAAKGGIGTHEEEATARPRPKPPWGLLSAFAGVALLVLALIAIAR
ncbi:MAG: hypothetical protein AAGK37_15325 [Pseudomonadota bacterium]